MSKNYSGDCEVSEFNVAFVSQNLLYENNNCIIQLKASEIGIIDFEMSSTNLEKILK